MSVYDILEYKYCYVLVYRTCEDREIVEYTLANVWFRDENILSKKEALTLILNLKKHLEEVE